MLKKLFIISNLLLLAACDPFEGVLSVKQQMIIQSSEKSPGCSPDDQWGCNQIVNVTVPVGDHSAKLEFVSRDQIQLNLKINGNKKQLNLDLPKKLNIPDNGAFDVSAKDLGQNFAARGDANTVVVDSQVQRGWDQCTYQRSEVVCGPQGCHTEWRTVYGQQQVEYFERRTNQKISVNFINEQTTGLLSNFSGERNFSEKIYTYRGQCY